eukprot:6212120-Karenia_brevis.AAC.1
MYQHAGIAWAVAAQFIFRPFTKSKDRHPGHEVYEHQVQLQERAVALQYGYQSAPKVLVDKLAAT